MPFTTAQLLHKFKTGHRSRSQLSCSLLRVAAPHLALAVAWAGPCDAHGEVVQPYRQAQCACRPGAAAATQAVTCEVLGEQDLGGAGAVRREVSVPGAVV